MNIYGCDLSDLSLSYKGLVAIADLQLGYEESLNKKGVLLPRRQFPDIRARVERLLLSKPKYFLLNGDIKHEFCEISGTEWRHIKELIRLIQERSKLVIIRGNHDNMLLPVLGDLGLRARDYYTYDRLFFCHGDRLIKNQDYNRAHTIVIGHEHPAVVLTEKNRRETYKCFLAGRFQGKNLIVMPSFNTLVPGSDITRGHLGPFLESVSDFRVLVQGPKVLDFGLVRNLGGR